MGGTWKARKWLRLSRARSTSSQRIVYFPVRHHSPACAWHVGRLIRELRPESVLIEGPRDATPLLPLLTHGETRMPVAFYSTYVRKRPGRHARSAMPPTIPCASSRPSWLPSERGLEVGAKVRFIDLTFPEKVEAHQFDREEGADCGGGRRACRRSLVLAQPPAAGGLRADRLARPGRPVGPSLRGRLPQRRHGRVHPRRARPIAPWPGGTIPTKPSRPTAAWPASRPWPPLSPRSRGGRSWSPADSTRLPCRRPRRPCRKPMKLAPEDNQLVLDALQLRATRPAQRLRQRHAVARVLPAGVGGAGPGAAHGRDRPRLPPAEPGRSPPPTPSPPSRTSQRLARLRGHEQASREDLLDGIRSVFIKGADDAEGVPVLALARKRLAGDRVGNVPAEAGQPPIVARFPQHGRSGSSSSSIRSMKRKSVLDLVSQDGPSRHQPAVPSTGVPAGAVCRVRSRAGLCRRREPGADPGGLDIPLVAADRVGPDRAVALRLDDRRGGRQPAPGALCRGRAARPGPQRRHGHATGAARLPHGTAPPYPGPARPAWPA